MDVAKALEVKINFQNSDSETPDGYLPDIGEIFGDRGNGYSYGWDQDIQGDARERNANSDQRYDTIVQFQEDGIAKTWEIELPNGSYELFVACGEPSYDDQIDTIDVEGVILNDPDGRDNYDEYDVTVTVSDGRLTIQPAPGGLKCKIMFLHISTLPIFKAFDPVPVDTAIHPESSVTLSWTPGDFADSHKVYFSDSFDDVSAGNDEAFQIIQANVVDVPYRYRKDHHFTFDGQMTKCNIANGNTFVLDLHPFFWRDTQAAQA